MKSLSKCIFRASTFNTLVFRVTYVRFYKRLHALHTKRAAAERTLKIKPGQIWTNQRL